MTSSEIKVESKYSIVEVPRGFLIEGRDRPPVRVAAEPYYLKTEHVGTQRGRGFGFYSYRPLVRDVVEGFGYRPSAPRRPDISAAYGELHLLPTAPVEVVRAAHKALVRLHHPDRGGDGEVMAKINAAHDLVSRSLAGG